MLPGDPVTAVADAVAVLVDDVAKPLLDQDKAQEYDNQFTEACQQIADTFSSPEGPHRDRALGVLASRVCIDNGYPLGDVGDQVVDVPVAYLDALLTIGFARTRDNQKLNALVHALTTK